MSASLPAPIPHRPRSVRAIKIEADGDPWKQRISPKIRLRGRWLEQAGFKPGHHVYVTCITSGVLELRVPETWLEPEPLITCYHFE